jgi:hypothetical protein
VLRAALVSHIYQTATTGAQPLDDDLQGSFAPAASGAARELVARHAEGDVDSYAIDSVDDAAECDGCWHIESVELVEH